MAAEKRLLGWSGAVLLVVGVLFTVLGQVFFGVGILAGGTYLMGKGS